MKKLLLLLLSFPLFAAAQGDSLERPNAILFEMGGATSFWLGQDVDNGFHNTIAGDLVFRGKLNERMFLSIGIGGFAMPEYVTNDTISISNSSVIFPNTSYYAVSTRSSGGFVPVKFTYMILNKGKLRAGVQASYNIFCRVHHQLDLTEVETPTHLSHQDFWVQGSVNAGAPANFALELPVSWQLKKNELLLTPFAFFASPKGRAYGDLLMVGARLGIGFPFRKMDAGTPTPPKKKAS